MRYNYLIINQIMYLTGNGAKLQIGKETPKNTKSFFINNTYTIQNS